MIKNKFIQNIKKNNNDYGYGVNLRSVSIVNEKKSNIQCLMGLEYKHDYHNKRNLYSLENKELIGVIMYDINLELELDDKDKIKKSIKHSIFIDDNYL